MPQSDIATIAEITRVHAVKRPDSVAMVVGERTITFAELDARSSQAAQAFRAAGVGSASCSSARCANHTGRVSAAESAD
jgi:long-chain acyl-CoA synthetase